VSNLNARLSQRFLALVLLPRVRSDILTHQRLHFALFQALKKATYKPGAFYKGLLLPLCASGTCSLREAVIFSSVLRRSSLPVLHSAAALLRLAQMPYAGTTSFFIRVLLDKKYALPYKVGQRDSGPWWAVWSRGVKGNQMWVMGRASGARMKGTNHLELEVQGQGNGVCCANQSRQTAFLAIVVGNCSGCGSTYTVIQSHRL
jgi:hypothetical protein